MKNLLNPGWILLIGFLFMQHPSTAQSSQRYDNSLKVQYGMFQYNNNQQDFISSSPNSFLNVGLSYRQRLNRYSDLNLSGRYYDWNLKNGDALKTYAFQPMWVLHTRKISSSWQINRLIPYIGIGIGVENHVLTHLSTDSSYWKMYVPVEAGLQFNLNSRWSVGVFAEYKFATFSTLKNLVTNVNKSLDLVNSSGISLSYNFGKNKKEVLFPVIKVNDALTETGFISKNETVIKTDSSSAVILINTGIQRTLVDTLIKQVSPETLVVPAETEKHNFVVVPRITTIITDTINVPINLNISVNKQEGMPLVSPAVKAKTDKKLNVAYEKKIDSLSRVVKLQDEKLKKIDSDNRISNIKSAVKDTIVIQTVPMNPAIQPATSPAAAVNSTLAATVAQNANRTNTIQEGVQKLQRDMDNTNRKIRQIEAEKTNNPPAQVVKAQEVIPVATFSNDSLQTPVKVRDTIIIKIVTPPSETKNLNDVETQKADTLLRTTANDSVKLIKLSVDSLSQNQKYLMKELKNLKTQNEELQKKTVIESPKPDSLVKANVPLKVVYTVTFALNSSRVNPKFRSDLKALADSVKKNPGKKMQLSGYSDRSGQAAYNLILSQKRVRAVKNELIKLGVSKKQIVEQYFGSELSKSDVNVNDRKVVIHLL